MKKIRYIIGSLLMTVMIIMTDNIYASAAEFKFSVNPIQSSKQLDKSLTYFDIMLKPNEQENLQVKLGNATDKDVKVDISINGAKTNGNGVVEYRNNKLKNTNNLPVDISNIVEFPDQVIVPAKSEKIVDFKIKMPEKFFDGLIAGGIQFRENGQENKSDDNKDAVAINNTFSYVLALLIRENENEVIPDVSLNKVFINTQYGRSNTILRLQNNSASYLNKMAIDAKVYYENSKDAISAIKKIDMQFAPNSIMDFRIGMGTKAINAGTYSMIGTLYGDKSSLGKYEYNGEKYRYKINLNQNFKVTNKNAKEVNEENIILEKNNNKIWIIIILCLLVMIITLFAIIVFILKKRKKTSDK